jgi:hypothetical protein
LGLQLAGQGGLGLRKLPLAGNGGGDLRVVGTPIVDLTGGEAEKIGEGGLALPGGG